MKNRTLYAYLTEARYESMRMLRAPSFALPFLLIPVMVYLLMGVVIFGSALRHDPKSAIGVFAGLTVFGMMGPGMFGFGVSVAMEREHGFLQLRRALPAPGAGYFVAKMCMAMLFNAIIMITMIAADLAAGHLPLSFMQLAGLAIIKYLRRVAILRHRSVHRHAGHRLRRPRLGEFSISADDVALGSVHSAAKIAAVRRAGLACASRAAAFAGRAGPTVGGRLVDAHRGARGVDPGPFGRCGPPPCASWLRLAAGQGNRFLTVAARYPPSRFRTIFGAATVRERFSSKRLSTRKTPSQKPTERFLPLSHQIGWRRRSTNPEPPS